ncbi:MAG: hypothetical protein A2076_12145 [Geobacteraceae bacterium GWC2_53_11]|nr:MAG: hypothetical protein A2076_12145 [Geobacteraceae bacterium GWC2_53_11]
MNEDNKTVEVVKPVPLKNLPDLKAIREERGLTTEDIFLKTRINSAILNAIEHGEFHLLPAPVSTKKFIRIYAETIGIDAEIILAHYQRYVDEKQVPEEINVVKASAALERKPFSSYLRYILPAVAIIAAVCIMYAFVPKKEPQGIVQQDVTKGVAPAPVPPPAPAVKEPLPEALPTVPPTTAPAVIVPKEAPQTPDTAHLNLLVEATEDTWLSITEDRKAPFQITLKKGEKLSRTAREFFVIDVGNAAGVNINFLGKSLGTLGRKGQVVHLRLPQQ